MNASITLITPTLCSAEFINSALQSVVERALPGLHHIVQDGGSTDDTLERVQAFMHRYRNAGMTLTLCSEPDTGIYDAINHALRRIPAPAPGLERSEADTVVGVLHSDDFLVAPDGLRLVAQAFREDPALDAVYADIYYVSRRKASRIVRTFALPHFAPAMMLMGFQPPHSAFFCRRSLYERFGLYDPRYVIAGDFDFMLRALWRGKARIKHLPITLTAMRSGGTSGAGWRAHLLGLWEHQLAYVRQRVPSCILFDAPQLIHKLMQVKL